MLVKECKQKLEDLTLVDMFHSVKLSLIGQWTGDVRHLQSNPPSGPNLMLQLRLRPVDNQPIGLDVCKHEGPGPRSATSRDQPLELNHTHTSTRLSSVKAEP